MSYLSSLNIHPQGQTSLWHSGKAQPSDAPEMRENNCQLKTFSSGRCAYPKWLTVHSRYIFDQYVYSQRSIMLYKLSSRSVLIAIKRKCQNQERYSTLSRLHQCAVHRLCTAHFPLYAELHFSLKVCFVLITSKGHPFISASHLPLICLCRQWDVKRHFWHLFPICAPTQRPSEQVLFRFHLLSACLSPWSPAVQGKPHTYLSKETKKNKKLRELWEKETEKER